MTNKILWMVGLVVVVSVFAGVNFVKSLTAPANYVIENIENWYGGNTDGVKDENLGAIEFNTGKTTYGELAEGVLQENVVFVTADQVRALERTPIELVADPGNNKVVQVAQIIAFREFSSESWDYNPNRTTIDGDSDVYQEGFEVKWGSGPNQTASGMNGAFALGASFSRGLINGGTQTGNIASPSIEFWQPSGKLLIDDAGGVANSNTASSSFLPTLFASPSSGVFLTASTSFRNSVGAISDTRFWFRVIYRVLTLPQTN